MTNEENKKIVDFTENVIDLTKEILEGKTKIATNYAVIGALDYVKELLNANIYINCEKRMLNCQNKKNTK